MGQERVDFASGKMVRCIGAWGGFIDVKFGSLLCKIVRKLRDDVSDTAARIRDITAVAWDEVDVQVGDGLTGSGPDVDADVVALGLVLGFDMGFGDFQGTCECLLFFTRGIEPGGDMPSRDDQQMAGTYREPIPEGDDVCGSDGVPKDDAMAIDLTERAEHCWGA